MITDADVRAGARNAMIADSLDSVLTGGIFSGPGAGERVPPYAQLSARPKRVQLYIPATSGEVYVDFRRLMVAVWGVGQTAVSSLMKQVATSLCRHNWQVTSLPIANCLPEDDGATLVPDPESREGEDVWKGTVVLEVAARGVI